MTGVGQLPGVHGELQEGSPDTGQSVYAVGYYFGRDFQKSLKVPVGVIHTSWGGPRAEAWTRREVLESHPEWQGEFPAYEKAKANYPKALEKYKAEQARGQEAAAKAQPEVKNPRATSRPPQDPAHNS